MINLYLYNYIYLEISVQDLINNPMILLKNKELTVYYKVRGFHLH